MQPTSQALLLAAGSKLHKLSNHIHRVCFQKALSILRTTQERTEGIGEGNSLPVVLPKILLREASLRFLSQHLDVDKVIYIYLHLSFRGQARHSLSCTDTRFSSQAHFPGDLSPDVSLWSLQEEGPEANGWPHKRPSVGTENIGRRKGQVEMQRQDRDLWW